MANRRGTPAAVAAQRAQGTYEMQLPPASIALMQAANAKIAAAQSELGVLVASMLSVLVTDGGIATNVDIDTGVVTLTRGPNLTEVPPEE